MADKERKWSVDWRTFNWKVVDKEIEEKKLQNEGDITTITKDIFVEYIHWLNENAPKLLYIVAVLYRLQQEGAPEKEIDKLRKLWNELTGNKE